MLQKIFNFAQRVKKKGLSVTTPSAIGFGQSHLLNTQFFLQIVKVLSELLVGFL